MKKKVLQQQVYPYRDNVAKFGYNVKKNKVEYFKLDFNNFTIYKNT